MISVGSTVGNYRVVQKIGQGAMGEVWLATHPVIGKRVALKVIHPELSTNEEMIARFFNEARAVTQIGHDNIVEMQDFGQTPEGDSFMIMELLEGRDLGQIMKEEGSFSVSRTMHIGMQMADGLAAAHARGIYHRDLKPDNVFLVERGGDSDFVKILDFGLAKLTGPGAMNHKTKEGSLLGTPHYMAPEQAEGKKYDHRVDVYGLGCILFHMLSGRVPFQGQGFGEVLVKHLRDPPPLLTRINPLVPPAVEKIVLHALAKKPEFRFASMEAFRAAMRDPERFAQKLDSAEDLRHTPGEPFPAPQLPMIEAPSSPTMIAPASAPIKLPDNAPTVQGEAPAEVLAILKAREEAARNASAAGFDISTAPGQMRQQSKTMAQPAPAAAQRRAQQQKKRGNTGLLVALGAGGALMLAGGLGLYLWKFATSTVELSSAPTGAEVTCNGAVLGKTPLEHQAPSRTALRCMFKKRGFSPVERGFVPKDTPKLRVVMQIEDDESPTEPTEPADVKPTKTPVKTVEPTPSDDDTPPEKPKRPDHPKPDQDEHPPAGKPIKPVAKPDVKPEKPVSKHHHSEPKTDDKAEMDWEKDPSPKQEKKPVKKADQKSDQKAPKKPPAGGLLLAPSF